MQLITSRLRRLALLLSFSACLIAPQTAAAQALTAPRYHDQRPVGCVRSSVGAIAVRDCVYPDGSFGMWTDQDGGAVLVAFDDDDGNGLQFTDDGLYLLGLA